MKSYLYSFFSTQEFPGIVFFNVVSEDFWKKHEYMVDETPEGLREIFANYDIYETMEAVFEFPGTEDRVREIFENLKKSSSITMEYNKDLEEFLSESIIG